MRAEMFFDEFIYQSGDRAANRCDEMQCVGTRRVGSYTPLDGSDLTCDAMNPRNDLGAAVCNVTHRIPPYGISENFTSSP